MKTIKYQTHINYLSKIEIKLTKIKFEDIKYLSLTTVRTAWPIVVNRIKKI